MDKVCQFCGKGFVGWPTRKTCSPECKRRWGTKGSVEREKKRKQNDPAWREKKQASNNELRRKRYRTDEAYREKVKAESRERKRRLRLVLKGGKPLP